MSTRKGNNETEKLQEGLNARHDPTAAIQIKHPGLVSESGQVVVADSVWNTLSLSSTPFAGHGATFEPGVAVHNEKLWILWQPNDSANLLQAVMNMDETWTHGLFQWNIDQPGEGDPLPATAVGPPALAEVGDKLHAVFCNSDSLVHYIYDETASCWYWQGTVNVITTNYPPAIAEYKGRLYLAFLDDSQRLCWAQWIESNGWSAATTIVTKEDGNTQYAWDGPGLLVLDDQLHLIFPAHNNRSFYELVFDGTASWTFSPHRPGGESTAGGMTCSSYTTKGLLAFPKNVSNNRDAEVLVCIWEHGSWGNSTGDGATGQNTQATPLIAELNEQAYVVFIAANNSRELCITKRSLDYPFLQGTWMKYAYVANPQASLTDLVIPGTHDSCASGGGYIIQTQNLSLIDMLRIGIRFFDLRVGFMPGGDTLYMFHGKAYLLYGVSKIRFDEDVLITIRDWLAVNTETVIISIKKAGFGDESSAFEDMNVTFGNYKDYIWDQARFPTLAEAQAWAHGKMVLLLRTDSVNCPLGIRLPDPSQWPNNTKFFQVASPAGPQFLVQDFWDLDFPWGTGVANKLAAVKDAMSKAAAQPEGAGFVCFTSGTFNPADLMLGSPETVATGCFDYIGINESMLREGWSTKVPGIYPMDFADNPVDLIPTLIGLNFPAS